MLILAANKAVLINVSLQECFLSFVFYVFNFILLEVIISELFSVI